jgi:hypothetical protein
VALITVLAFAIPIAKTALTRKFEHVTARVVSQGDEHSLGRAMVVLLSNDGTVSAFVEPRAGLISKSSRGTEAFSVNLLPEPFGVTGPWPRSTVLSNLLLEASGQRALFATVSERAPTIVDSEPNADCELRLTIHKLDGTKRNEIYKYQCFDWNMPGKAPR